MFLKRVLLSSTTIALFMASYALANPSPSLEAEPVEYVRICDSFGKGYFYIPGTNSCMAISGYVRSDIVGGDHLSGNTVDDVFGSKSDSYRWKARAELKFHTKTSTELGALSTLITLRSEWKDGKDGGGGQLRRGYIELGGLRVGLTETTFYEWTDKYGEVLNDDLIGPASHRTNAISYTFTAKNGFSAIIALEQGNGEAYTGYKYSKDVLGTPVVSKAYALRQGIDGYTPNIVGGLKYEASWGSLASVIAYDAYYEEWATRLRLNLNVTDKLSLWLMGAYKSADDYYAIDTSYGTKGVKTLSNGNKRLGVYRLINSMYGDWGGDWAAWFGGSYIINKKASFNFQFAYEAAKTFTAAANIKFKVTSGLVVTPEIAYISWNDSYGYSTQNGSYEVRQSLKGRDALSSMIRMQRSF